VGISERDSRAVPNPRGRQVNVEPHNAVSCLRLVFAAHTRCVCASWRLLPGSLKRLPSARTGRPPQRGRPACDATVVVPHLETTSRRSARAPPHRSVRTLARGWPCVGGSGGVGGGGGGGSGGAMASWTSHWCPVSLLSSGRCRWRRRRHRRCRRHRRSNAKVWEDAQHRRAGHQGRDCA